MQRTTNNSLNPSSVFVVLFLLSALMFTIWSMNRIPHYVILWVNNQWAIMLIGEKDVGAVQFHPNKFTVLDKNPGGIKLNGYGKLLWHDHRIKITKGSVYFDNTSISRSSREAIVNIMLYPDGRMTKGRLQ